MKYLNVFAKNNYDQITWILKDISVDELRHILKHLSKSIYVINSKLTCVESDSLESYYYQEVSKLELIPDLVLCSWLNN